LTDNENPYGVLPPVLARSVGRMSGMLLADYIGEVLQRRRQSRAAPPPRQPPYANFHGGERYYIVLAYIFDFTDRTLTAIRSNDDPKSKLASCQLQFQFLHETER
jgi:hypothetical protein